MWNLIKASAIGTSHRSRGQPCQDSCEGRIVENSTGPILVAAVADGAGSAAQSEVGAELACKAFVDRVGQTISSVDFDLATIDRATMLDWFADARRQVGSDADGRGVSIRELACTLLAAIVGEGWAVFAQVGDGAIVRQIDGDLSVVFWPEEAEYANMTYFLTEGDFADHFQFSRDDGPIDALAMFTDGLQRLTLDFATKEAHSPFFNPIFEYTARLGDPAKRTAALVEFLGSPLVNDRTDDDKTLLLAARRIPPQNEPHLPPAEFE